jgi:hypothetical protein
MIKNKIKIPKLEEDFYNPFEENDSISKEPIHLSDKSDALALKKDNFSPSQIHWTKTDNGDYTVKANGNFYKGDIVEICPIIMLNDSAISIETLKDKVFEIDKGQKMYGVVLGYGTLYKHSQTPNLDFAYNKSTRQMHFIAKKSIQKNEELTIDYGKDYWEQRMNFNNTPEVEESEIQHSNIDIQRKEEIDKLSDPNNPQNPGRTGQPILGLGQQ